MACRKMNEDVAYARNTENGCKWKQTTNTKEKNVVRLWAAVSLGGALRDIPKNGCGGD